MILRRHFPSAATLEPVSYAARASSQNLRPPKPLRIWVPLLSRSSSSSSLPVVVFQHGFASQNWFYSQLLTRIASHGYIVAAPQVREDMLGYDT